MFNLFIVVELFIHEYEKKLKEWTHILNHWKFSFIQYIVDYC